MSTVSVRVPEDIYKIIMAARRPGQSFGGALREMLAADARAKAAPQVQSVKKK